MRNTTLLQSSTKALAKYYGDGVSEIMINRPGEVWVDKSGNMVRFSDDEITHQMIDVMVKTIAGQAGMSVNSDNPLLSTTLPVRTVDGKTEGGERVQVVYSPVVPTNETAISIRIPSHTQFSIDDYKKSGAFSEVKVNKIDDTLKKMYEKKDWYGFLVNAVKQKKTMIQSGGTSTGKTTFVNTCTSLMGLNERIITVEDSLELNAPQKNQVNMLTVPEKKDSNGNILRHAITTRDLIASCLRMNPDRIIKGELRGAEAFDFLRAVNSGHPGSQSTIHADTTMGALNALGQLVLQANLGWGIGDIKNYITSVVDIVVQWKRQDDKRFISDIWWKEAT